MRRVLLLAVLAFGLPTLALADSFDYSGNQAISLSGSFSTSLSATTNLSSINGVSTGVSGTINVMTGTLTSEACGGGLKGKCYGFTGGSVTITGSSGVIFQDALSGGLVHRHGNTLSITGDLSGAYTGIASLNATFHTKGDTFTVVNGSADITGSTVPEPSTIGLLGTGLVGLAGIVRRKLRS